MKKALNTALLFASLFAFSQATNSSLIKGLLDSGDAQFEAKQYIAAVSYYKRALQLKSSSIKAEYQLAECYRQMQDYESAAYYYQRIGERQDIRYPLAGFYHGLMQKLKGEYDQALVTFKKFTKFLVLNGLHEEDPYRYYHKQAKIEIDGCQLALTQITLIHPDYQFLALAAPLNSPYNDYAAFTVWDDDMVCLTSARASGKGSQLDQQFGEAYADIFRYTKGASGVWDEISSSDRFEKIINSKLGEGSGAFNKDRTKFYYTNCDEVCHIFFSRLSGGKWTDPVPLNHNINEIGFNSQHPSITAGGDTLFFASDREGGMGELDIWMSFNAGNENWGPAIHLGDQINTPFKEISPFYDQKEDVLFFASNGHRGFGGFDIYIAKGDKFATAEIYNAGIPFNSFKDDIFFFLGNQKGYLSSNREEGMGKFDIFGFSIKSKEEIMSEVAAESTIAGRNSLFTDDYNFDSSEAETITQIISRKLSSAVSEIDLVLTDTQLEVYNSLSLDDKERIERIVQARIRKMTDNMIKSIRSEDDYYYQQLSASNRQKVDNIVTNYLEQQGLGYSVSLSGDILQYYDDADAEEQEKIDILISDRLKTSESFVLAAPTYNSFTKEEQKSLDGITEKYLSEKKNLEALRLDLREKVFLRDNTRSEEDVSKAIRENMIGLSTQEKYKVGDAERDYYETLTQKDKDNLSAIATTFMVSDLSSFEQTLDEEQLDVYRNKNQSDTRKLDKILVKIMSNMAKSSTYLAETNFTFDELQLAISESADETYQKLVESRPHLTEEQRLTLKVFVKTAYEPYMAEPSQVFFDTPPPIITVSSSGPSAEDVPPTLSNTDLDAYDALPASKKRVIDNLIGLDYLNETFYNRAKRLRDEAELARLPKAEAVHITILAKKVSGEDLKPNEEASLTEAFTHYNNLSKGRKSFFNRMVLERAFETKNDRYVLSKADARTRGQLTVSDRNLMERIKTFRFKNERVLTENLRLEAQDVEAPKVDLIAMVDRAQTEEDAPPVVPAEETDTAPEVTPAPAVATEETVPSTTPSTVAPLLPEQDSEAETLLTLEGVATTEQSGQTKVGLSSENMEGYEDYEEITIAGQLIEPSTQNPLPNHPVKLIAYDTEETVTESYTDNGGYFSFNTKAKQYDISFDDVDTYTSAALSALRVDGKKTADASIKVSDTRAFFDVNAYALRPETVILLDEVIATIQTEGGLVEIESHTDATGSLDYNLQLSKKRGYAARDYLIENGVDMADISVIWHGQGKPIADNDSPFGRQLNRRLDLRLINQTEQDFGRFYLVRPAADIYSLAGSFDVTAQHIRDLNGLTAGVRAYQPIRIKEGSKRPDYNLVIPADIVSNSDFIYIVKYGDNLEKVATKFNVPEELLLEQNNLYSTDLIPGTSLIIYPSTED